MHHVAMDLFDADAKKWLVMVDRYSGYAWLKQLQKTTTAKIIACISDWFLDFGWPEVTRSDGGPQFRQEFAEFCSAHSISHELTSPYIPESNGLAESAVKNLKSLVIKCKDSGEDLKCAISAWRNMAREDGITPSQAFFNRRQRQVLPLRSNELLLSEIDIAHKDKLAHDQVCLLYTSPSPRDLSTSRMPSSA